MKALGEKVHKIVVYHGLHRKLNAKRQNFMKFNFHYFFFKQKEITRFKEMKSAYRYTHIYQYVIYPICEKLLSSMYRIP